MKKRNIFGFTLIELLIGIFIVMIVLALIVGVIILVIWLVFFKGHHVETSAMMNIDAINNYITYIASYIPISYHI